MKIEKTIATKIQITDVYGLDPVSVYLEDFEPRKGKITISCWDKSWHSYWGGMGDRTISEFFLSCDNHYIAKNLSSIKSSINDYEALSEKIKAFYGDDIDYFVLEELSELSGDQNDGYNWTQTNHKVMNEVLGCDWFYDVPTMQNPKYKYLCSIIDTVKDALRQVNKSDKNTSEEK